LAVPPSATSVPARRHDWGDAPAAPVVQGRAEELATLARWVTEEHCRLVEILGVGGIGKTTVAARLAYELAPTFAVVYWRSLRNALPVEEWLAGAIAALSAGQAVALEGFAARLVLLVELLRAQRALLVLDNLETILEPGAPAVRYRAGYEGYGAVLARLAESTHQSCLLLTSREQPLQADDATVRSLRLEGLGVDAGRLLLGGRGLASDTAAWQALVDRYGGNPLALSIVGETIGVVFRGDTAAFLAQDVAVFGGIRQLLEEQVGRLSALEQTILTGLAVEREPVGFAALVADLGPGVGRGEAVEAVEALLRRSLLEWGTGGSFTLQPVVLEYATARLVAAIAQEIRAGEPTLLVRRALLKAQAKDYVRRSQERLIAQPLLERVNESLGSAAAVERQLLALLGRWRGQPAAEQGYGPGNVVNLLRLLRGDLRGLDFSRLAIRHAYLQEVEAQDASLAGAHLSATALAEAFNYATALALSADAAYLAAGTSAGEVCLWRLADCAPLLAIQGHTGAVLSVALCRDGALPVAGEAGRLVASGGFDGTVRLWDVPSGRLVATLQGHMGAVWGVALSGDGRLVASGSQDGMVKLWEAGSGNWLRATLQGHTGAVRGVALSGAGALLASASQDGTIKLWEAGSERLLATLQGYAGGVRGVALSGDGRLAASSSFDGTAKLWEVETGRLLVTLQGHAGGVPGVALHEDGRLIASGSLDGTVKLWEVETGRLLATLQGHAGAVYSVGLSGDGRLLASGSFDGTVKLWEVMSGACLGTLRGDRRYERLDITALTGVTEAQKATLRALGAIEQAQARTHSPVRPGQP
jgi:WD domain, G-beta repeat